MASRTHFYPYTIDTEFSPFVRDYKLYTMKVDRFKRGYAIYVCNLVLEWFIFNLLTISSNTQTHFKTFRTFRQYVIRFISCVTRLLPISRQ